jgi:hypothetical protein
MDQHPVGRYREVVGPDIEQKDPDRLRRVADVHHDVAALQPMQEVGD